MSLVACDILYRKHHDCTHALIIWRMDTSLIYLFRKFCRRDVVQVVNTCGKRYLDLKGKETVEGHVDFLTKNLSNFSEAPFTLQRLCEILVNAEAHYKSTHKLVYALTKLLSVTSTYPRGSGQYTDNREMETADPAPMDVDDT